MGRAIVYHSSQVELDSITALMALQNASDVKLIFFHIGQIDMTVETSMSAREI